MTSSGNTGDSGSIWRRIGSSLPSSGLSLGFCPARRCARLIVLVALQLDVVAVPSDSSTADSCLTRQGYAAVDMQRLPSGALLVDAAVDSSPFTLVLDPRATTSFLDITRINKLGYETTRADTDVRVGSRREPVYQLDIPALQLGKVHVGKTSVLLTRIDYFVRAAGIDDDTSVGGIIGIDLLRRWSAVLDLKANRMFFMRPVPEPTPPADSSAVTKDETVIEKIERRMRERKKR